MRRPRIPSRASVTRYFYGWNVVAATFVVALFAFGLGFYGVSVYLAALQRVHGWSASSVSAPVTVYYVAGAMLSAWIGDAYQRFGPRVVITVGSLAMATGVTALGVVTQPWHLYPVFLVMAIGWGAMSGAALNLLVAPWFERRRGLAVSIAFNGATLGGVIIAPILIPLIDALGFTRAVATAAVVSLVALLSLAAFVMRRGPDALGLGPDGDAPVPARHAAPVERGRRSDEVRTWRFWSISAPFALGLTAQVGVLTHQVSLLAPVLPSSGAARAVSITTAAALIGRLITGVVVDRLNRRLVASVTLVVQLLGVGILALSIDRPSASGLMTYAGCALFGLGVGNMTTLPGLILAAEWPRERFSALIGLVVGINQFTFAFGPSLVGIVRDASGHYAPALAVCMALELLAAVMVLQAPRARRGP